MERIRRAFGEHFGSGAPTHVASAPGRINLIGEHIDYNGLSVLPMALERRVSLAFRTRSDQGVRATSSDSRFEPLEFTISPSIEPGADGEWGNYMKAAAQALAELNPELIGMDAVVVSNIPVAAGLSSSSALVVATAFALIEANNMALERTLLMDLLADAERYVGTRGGGMDQAICIAAKEGYATRVRFHPLRLESTPVPRDWRFVVANSLVQAQKSGAARETYNQRTWECREALLKVTGELGVIDEVDSYSRLLASVQVERILTAAGTALNDTLSRRFMHVISEAVRVIRAERAMRESDIETFGRLMSESHRSLRDDYDVSGPELDQLVEIAACAGAEGARLTGAGLGGCIIALCTPATVDNVMDALRKDFYSTRSSRDELDDALFVARPGAGATVVSV